MSVLDAVLPSSPRSPSFSFPSLLYLFCSILFHLPSALRPQAPRVHMVSMGYGVDPCEV